MYYQTEIPAQVKDIDDKSKLFISNWLYSRKSILGQNIQKYNNAYNNAVAQVNEEATNGVLLNQINNMNKSPMTIEKYLPNDSYGNEVYGQYNKQNKSIQINSKLVRSKNTPLLENYVLHERSHSLRPIPQEFMIKSFLDQDKSFNKNSKDPYLDRTDEIYSRLMSFRNRFGLKPDQAITSEDLNKWTGILKDFDLRRYSDDFLLNLFNGVAKVDKPDNKLLQYGKNKLRYTQNNNVA